MAAMIPNTAFTAAALKHDSSPPEFPSGIFATEDQFFDNSCFFKTQDGLDFQFGAESSVDYALRRMSDTSIVSTDSSVSSTGSIESFELEYLNLSDDPASAPTSTHCRHSSFTQPAVPPPAETPSLAMAGFPSPSPSYLPTAAFVELGPPRSDDDFRQTVYGGNVPGSSAMSLALPYISGMRRASPPDYALTGTHGQSSATVPRTPGMPSGSALSPPDISSYQFPRTAFPSPPMSAGFVTSPPPPSTAASTSTTFSLTSPPSTASSFSVAPVQSSPTTHAVGLPATNQEYANIFVRGDDGAYRLQRIASRPHVHLAHAPGVYPRVVSAAPRAFGAPHGYHTISHLPSPPILTLHRGGAKRLPSATKEFLKSWLFAHADHPYPTEEEKQELCALTGMSMPQLSNWMINARRRILAPAKLAGKIPSVSAKLPATMGGDGSPPVTVHLSPQPFSVMTPPMERSNQLQLQMGGFVHSRATSLDFAVSHQPSGETPRSLGVALDDLFLAPPDEGDENGGPPT